MGLFCGELVYTKQAEVELRLTQAEAVRLSFGYELSSLLNSEVSYEEDIKIGFCKML